MSGKGYERKMSCDQDQGCSDRDKSQAVPADLQNWSKRRKSDISHPVTLPQVELVQISPHPTVNKKFANRRRHSVACPLEDLFDNSLSLQDRPLEGNKASPDKTCRPSTINFLPKEQRGVQFQQRDQWSPSRNRYSFKGHDKHRLPVLNDKMQNTKRRTSLTNVETPRHGDSILKRADSARRNSMVNDIRHSQSDIPTPDPDVSRRRYSHVNMGAAGLQCSFSNVGKGRRNSLAGTANVDASLRRNTVLHDGIAKRRNSWTNGNMSPCDRRHNLASEIGNIQNNILLSKIYPDSVNSPVDLTKSPFRRTSSGNMLVTSFSIQQKMLLEREKTKDMLPATSRENVVNQRSKQFLRHHSFDSKPTNGAQISSNSDLTRKLDEGFVDIEHITCNSKLPLPGIPPSNNGDGNPQAGTQAGSSFRPKSCWCLRCQFMLTMHRIGDDALENWGNYPCFRGRQDFRSQTPPGKTRVDVESDIDTLGVPPVDCEVDTNNIEMDQAEMIMKAKMNVEEQGGIQSFQDIETVEEEKSLPDTEDDMEEQMSIGTEPGITTMDSMHEDNGN